MNKKTAKISINTILTADRVYEIVVAQLGIKDEIYRELVLCMLKRQTQDHIVFSIWQNLDNEQAKHLKEYMRQMFEIAPWMKHEDILMEFALQYPLLLTKIYAGLTEFFKNFVKRFRQINEA